MRPQKNDNSEPQVKISLRKLILEQLDSPYVLDCFAGKQLLKAACYEGLSYQGIDNRKDIEYGKDLMRMDNLRFLRTQDLQPYNMFDLDAYGSPWEQFLIVVSRAAKTRIGIAITDGLNLSSYMSKNKIPVGMRKYCNIPIAMSIPMLHRHIDFLRRYFVHRVISENGWQVKNAWVAKPSKLGSTVEYFGLILEPSC